MTENGSHLLFQLTESNRISELSCMQAAGNRRGRRSWKSVRYLMLLGDSSGRDCVIRVSGHGRRMALSLPSQSSRRVLGEGTHLQDSALVVSENRSARWHALAPCPLIRRGSVRLPGRCYPAVICMCSVGLPRLLARVPGLSGQEVPPPRPSLSPSTGQWCDYSKIPTSKWFGVPMALGCPRFRYHGETITTSTFHIWAERS